jgi:hypothetical protein
MPILDLQLTPDGAIITAFVCVSVPRRKALQRKRQPVPVSIPVRLLVDTGASCTCLEVGRVTPLNLTPTGKSQLYTASTGASPQPCDEYDASLVVPFSPSGHFTMDSLPIIECQPLDGPYDGLLGRDVLSHCTFFWNGIAGTFSIAF